MSAQTVLLPVFRPGSAHFRALLWMAGAAETHWSAERPGSRISCSDNKLARPRTQIGNCFKNQFELPILFYILIAIAMPLRHPTIDRVAVMGVSCDAPGHAGYL